MIDSFFNHLSIITILFFVASFALIALVRLFRNIDLMLDKLVNEALTSALFPTGLALLICSLVPTYVHKLADLGINIAISGVVVLFIAGRSTVNSFKN